MLCVSLEAQLDASNYGAYSHTLDSRQKMKRTSISAIGYIYIHVIIYMNHIE